jgi:hypothetical protein
MPGIHFEVLEEELAWLLGRNYQQNEAQQWFQNSVSANLLEEEPIARFPRPEAI